MRLILDKDSFKHFSKIMLTSAKLGDDLFFECRLDDFTIKSVNETRSMFFFTKFEKRFFQEYQLTEQIECKFKSKCCIVPFKSSARDEKNLHSMEFLVDKGKDSATFQLSFDSNDMSVHEVNYINTNLQIDLDEEAQFEHYLMAKNKNLVNLFAIFPNSNEYCVMSVEPDRIYFETYNFKANDLRTKFMVKSDVFLEYKITSKIQTTFLLKPMKTFLNSLDRNASCYFYFEDDNCPVHVVIRNDLFENKFIIASIEVDIDSYDEPPTTSVHMPREIAASELQADEETNESEQADANNGPSSSSFNTDDCPSLNAKADDPVRLKNERYKSIYTSPDTASQHSPLKEFAIEDVRHQSTQNDQSSARSASARTESARTESARTESARTESTRTESVRAASLRSANNQTASNQSANNRSANNRSVNNQTVNNQTAHNQTATNRSANNQSVNNQSAIHRSANHNELLSQDEDQPQVSQNGHRTPQANVSRSSRQTNGHRTLQQSAIESPHTEQTSQIHSNRNSQQHASKQTSQICTPNSQPNGRQTSQVQTPAVQFDDFDDIDEIDFGHLDEDIMNAASKTDGASRTDAANRTNAANKTDAASRTNATETNTSRIDSTAMNASRIDSTRLNASRTNATEASTSGIGTSAASASRTNATETNASRFSTNEASTSRIGTPAAGTSRINTPEASRFSTPKASSTRMNASEMNGSRFSATGASTSRMNATETNRIDTIGTDVSRTNADSPATMTNSTATNGTETNASRFRTTRASASGFTSGFNITATNAGLEDADQSYEPNGGSQIRSAIEDDHMSSLDMDEDLMAEEHMSESAYAKKQKSSYDEFLNKMPSMSSGGHLDEQRKTELFTNFMNKHRNQLP